MTFYDLVVAGLGGQGTLIIGKFLAEAAGSMYRYSSFFPNYGPTMRGGECECTVIFSDKEVSAPTILNPSVVILLGVRAITNTINEFIPRVRPDGIIIMDSLTSVDIKRNDIHLYSIPANEIATKLGNSQVANFVFLGAYIGATNSIQLDILETLMEKKMSGGKKKALLELNKAALREGVKIIAEGAK